VHQYAFSPIKEAPPFALKPKPDLIKVKEYSSGEKE